MIERNTDCPKCARAKWHATGHFNVNRHGLRRAALVCDACGYAFSSGRQDAIAAGEALGGVVEVEPAVRSVVPAPTLPGTRIRQTVGGLSPVGTLAHDWKTRQSGGED